MRIEDLKGLADQKRGFQQQDDEQEQDEEEPCKYFHVQACGPGGIADADGGFAERLYNHSVKYAKKDPLGFVEFPRAFLKSTWTPGQVQSLCGEDYQLAFDIEASKTYTKQEESKN